MSGPVIETPVSVEETLDRMSSLHGVKRSADAELLVLAAHFACVELGARMQLGAWSARAYVADALDVRHRLPGWWQRVVAGQARVGFVRTVASGTRHLSMAAAAGVDAGMAVRLRTPADAAPFSSNLTPVVDADRTEAYDPALAQGPETNWSSRLAVSHPWAGSLTGSRPTGTGRSAALLRDRAVARPARAGPPRRPHRHPSGHQARPPSRTRTRVQSRSTCGRTSGSSRSTSP